MALGFSFNSTMLTRARHLNISIGQGLSLWKKELKKISMFSQNSKASRNLKSRKLDTMIEYELSFLSLKHLLSTFKEVRLLLIEVHYKLGTEQL